MAGYAEQTESPKVFLTVRYTATRASGPNLLVKNEVPLLP